jgi:beta-lactamase regulating signal transducer with metallopeptidase domain
MERFSQLAWAQIWQVTLLVIVVGLIAKLVSRRWPHVAWTLWVIVIVKCITPPIWYSPSGLFCWSATEPILPHVEYALPDDVFGKSGKEVPHEKDPSNTIAAGPLARQADSQSLAIASQSPLASNTLAFGNYKFVEFFQSQQFANLTLGVWFSGAILIAGIVIHRWWTVFNQIYQSQCIPDENLIASVESLRKKLGISRRFNVVVTSANYGPCVFGFFKPTLILPEIVVTGTDQKTLHGILAHEIIHVRRGDTLLDLVQMFAQVLWWFHPMVWWANRQVNRLSEHCCDDETIAGLSCQPISYARGLLKVLELRNQIKPVVSFSGMRAVEVTRLRLESLISRRSRLLARAPLFCWLLALSGGLIFLPGALENISPFGKAEQRKNQVSLDSLAQTAFNSADWESASKHYQEILKDDPDNGLAWFRLGYALHSQAKFKEAIQAHKQAANYPKAKHIAIYNWACALCRINQHDEALAKLELAIKEGFQSYKILSEDVDWIALRDDPRFVSLLDKLHELNGDVYRQFDFFIGDWTVTDGSGKTLGYNLVTADAKGYLISEKWTGADGSTGSSINFYDPADNLWKQTWVNGAGNVLRLSGVFREGAMYFKGESIQKNGTKEQIRMTIAPIENQKVNQTVFKSTDNGQSWVQSYNVIYQPKK